MIWVKDNSLILDLFNHLYHYFDVDEDQSVETDEFLNFPDGPFSSFSFQTKLQ